MLADAGGRIYDGVCHNDAADAYLRIKLGDDRRRVYRRVPAHAAEPLRKRFTNRGAADSDHEKGVRVF